MITSWVKKASTVLALPLAYEVWSKIHLPTRVHLIRDCLQQLPDGARMLELACGPGITARYFPRFQYTGIDLSPEYISYAARKYRTKLPSARFVVGDVCSRETLPEETQSFDVVMLQGSLHHLEPEVTLNCLQNMRRYLKREGVALVVDQVVPGESEENAAVRRFLINTDRGKFTRSAKELRTIVETAFRVSLEADRTLFWGPVALWKYHAVVGRPKEN